MSAAAFFIDQETRKFESRCLSAIHQVNVARTMWEVKRASDVHPPSFLRGMNVHRQGAARQLAHAAEQKMTALLQAQLKEAAGIADLDARRAFVGKLRHKDWDAMRGDFSMLYRKADIEGQRLLAKP